VGKQLNVSSIVEGSVQRAGGRVKVIASLVTTSDGLTLWSDSYERDANDVFAVQAELSQAIASALRVSISGEEVARNIGTKNVQAHDLVLRGRFLNDVYTEASLRQAIARFQQALALDSTYADAWAGIAESWTRLADDFIAPHEALPYVREAVARAEALDPTSATVMAQRGSLAIQYDRDYATGMRLLERALRADSTDTGTFLLYATGLQFTAHPDSSRAVLQRALRLDPLSPLLTRAAAFTLSRLGDTSGARTACERAIELQPTNADCRLDQEFWAGRGARYVDSLRAVTHDSSYGRLRLAFFEASASQMASARRSVEVVLANARAHHRYMREVNIAASYAAMGDKEETLRWLERAYASDAGNVAIIPSMREFRLLDGEPRFEMLIRKIGLPKIR
jgi:tetratricopeptide (TPR) repeat protein